MREKTPPWRATILLAAVWFAVTGSRFAVGLVNDDADYLIAARSLAAGPFFEKLFNNHLLRDRLPGLPLLLAPFMGWVRPPYEPLKLVPFVLTVMSGFLLWELLKPWLTPRARWAVLALYLLNPLVGEYSARVMTEPLFTVQALAAFLLLRRVLAADEAWAARLLGILLGWAALVRGEGASLAAGVGLGLWIGGRRSRLAPVLATAAGLAGAVFLGNDLTHRTPTAYLQIWAASAARVSWVAHELRLARVLAWTAFGGAPRLPATPAELAGATTLALALAAAAGRGLSRLEREGGKHRGEVWAMAGFGAAYCSSTRCGRWPTRGSSSSCSPTSCWARPPA